MEKRMGFEDVESSEDLKKRVLSTKVLKRRKNRKIACVGKENPDFGGDTDFNFKNRKEKDNHEVLQGVSSVSFCDGGTGDDQAIYRSKGLID